MTFSLVHHLGSFNPLELIWERACYLFPPFYICHNLALLNGFSVTEHVIQMCLFCSLLQQAQKFFMETNSPADTRNVCVPTQTCILFVNMQFAFIYFSCFEGINSLDIDVQKLSWLIHKFYLRLDDDIFYDSPAKGIGNMFICLLLCRWVSVLLEKLFTLLRGLLLLHCLWSCWVSLPKSG